MEPQMVLVRAAQRGKPQSINEQFSNDTKPSPLQINYLESGETRFYSNVQLVSCQGTMFKLNSALLASVSWLLHKLLEDIEKLGEDCPIVIMTEISHIHLEFIYDFITTGTVWTEELNDDVEASFMSLGINLRELSFSSVYGNKLEQDIKNVISDGDSVPEAAEIDPLDYSKNKSEAKKPRGKKRKVDLQPIVDEVDNLEPKELFSVKKESEEVFKRPKVQVCFVFSCKTCGEDFDSATKLNKHKIEIHEDELLKINNDKISKFNAKQYKKAQERLGNTVKTHAERRKERHARAGTIVCTECGKSIKNTQQNIEYHNFQHLKPSEEFKCEICNKMHVSKKHLEKHMYQVHKEKTTCDQCGAVVATRRLAQHVHNYHTPEEKKRFRCECKEDCSPDCNFHCKPIKGFWTKLNLEDHLNMHRGIKPYTCKLGCSNVSFANHANLAAHIRSFHKGIKRKK